ncbi:hypothetical protein [Gloeothece verrucosa]|uniref:Uncharacterized protein n=1 Tax=Gloeothece verrucosa (strain PCC 7822) TaxID=497965 RepID=E0U9P0_GLOV7|nr:hypothetical protein [Gloeothece verrucosa]ADN13841.1 conserved hypothetical protein [Gloeothece verrucosa PCC 7822]
MLPTLADFGIKSPVYVRKIDKKSHWNPQSSNLEERVNQVADKVFKEDLCSLWYIDSDEAFYGVIAAISSGRNPRNQDIDFVWITDEELKLLNILKEQTKEGYCLFVQHLHYNILIDRETARRLCYSLIQKEREAQRCKKKSTQAILEYQNNKGCKALINNTNKCNCEK